MADTISHDAPFGFRVWFGQPGDMPTSHVHGDIECNYVIRGQMHYFLGGRFFKVMPARLSIFWGGMPHRLVKHEKNTHLFWMTLPLAWFMGCRLPPAVMQKLLAGEMIEDDAPPPLVLDTIMLERWSQDLAPGSRTRDTALLEIEARLQRLTLDTQRTSTTPADAGHIERLAAYMAEHFADDVSVKDIAAAADLHPVYAMSIFKKTCGVSLWDDFTRLRVGHAQRLLLSTEESVTHIAYASGFNTAGRFYEAFAKYAGVTPHKYRARARRGA